MNITRVRILPPTAPTAPPPRLRRPGRARVVATAELELDGALVIRDIRIVRDPAGRHLVCMPSRPKKVRCPGCGHLAGMTWPHCAACGRRLEKRHDRGAERKAVYLDLCFPATTVMRREIDHAVLTAYVEATTGKEQSTWTLRAV